MSAMQFVRSPNPFVVLSARERDVLQLVAHDLTDRKIAQQLEIGERTVRAHVSRIISKLGVASRVGAAVAFVAWTTRRDAGQHDGTAMADEPMDVPAPHM